MLRCSYAVLSILDHVVGWMPATRNAVVHFDRVALGALEASRHRASPLGRHIVMVVRFISPVRDSFSQVSDDCGGEIVFRRVVQACLSENGGGAATGHGPHMHDVVVSPTQVQHQSGHHEAGNSSPFSINLGSTSI